jgi:hypothetical protein
MLQHRFSDGDDGTDEGFEMECGSFQCLHDRVIRSATPLSD